MTELSTLGVDPKLTKLLVIDVMNDFCDDNSAYANSEYAPGKKRSVKALQRVVEKGIAPFLERAREHGLPIAFIQSIYQPGQYPDIADKWLTIDPDLKDPEWRIKIYKDLPKPNEPVFKKDGFKPFTYQGQDNGLASWLQGTEHVLVSGFLTDACIKEAVYALLERMYAPIVLEDCVSTSEYKIKTVHLQILDEFRKHEAMLVVNSKKVEF